MAPRRSFAGSARELADTAVENARITRRAIFFMSLISDLFFRYSNAYGATRRGDPRIDEKHDNHQDCE
jgi:hypothetical protein